MYVCMYVCYDTFPAVFLTLPELTNITSQHSVIPSVDNAQCIQGRVNKVC